MFWELVKDGALYKPFWALRDVSFEVYRGQVVGVIGRNGAGKSTLLKIITGTLDKTSGEVVVNGRISSILELGTGFHGEYTGRENIYLGGLMVGLTKEEVTRKMNWIIEFSELEDFIDQPFKTYSSGMQARLTFSTAISIEPDILIVDEALSVGDAAFQVKCFNKFQEFIRKNCTILLVSHSINTINSFCQNAMLIDYGKVLMMGQPKLVTNTYHEILFSPNKPDINSTIASFRETTSGKNEKETAVPDAAEPLVSILSPQEHISPNGIENTSEVTVGDRTALVVSLEKKGSKDGAEEALDSSRENRLNLDVSSETEGSENSLDEIPQPIFVQQSISDQTSGENRTWNGIEKMSESISGKPTRFDLSSIPPQINQILNKGCLYYGSRKAEFFDFGILDDSGKATTLLQPLLNYTFYCRIRLNEALDNLTVGMRIRTSQALDVFAANTSLHEVEIPPGKQGDVLNVTFRIKMNLGPGEYFATFGVRNLFDETFHHRCVDAFEFTVIADKTTDGVCLANLAERVSVQLVER